MQTLWFKAQSKQLISFLRDSSNMIATVRSVSHLTGVWGNFVSAGVFVWLWCDICMIQWRYYSNEKWDNVLQHLCEKWISTAESISNNKYLATLSSASIPVRLAQFWIPFQFIQIFCSSRQDDILLCWWAGQSAKKNYRFVKLHRQTRGHEEGWDVFRHRYLFGVWGGRINDVFHILSKYLRFSSFRHFCSIIIHLHRSMWVILNQRVMLAFWG